MGKYIDKDEVVSEIKRRKSELYLKIAELGTFESNTIGLLREVDLYDDILSMLDTIAIKEVDLEKEIDNIWNSRFNLGWDEKSLLSMNHEGFTTIAKHFYELGLQTQKGE